ncbi:MAG TPA: VacJ family lipoprotein [Caulobacteraceae bacterium]
MATLPSKLPPRRLDPEVGVEKPGIGRAVAAVGLALILLGPASAALGAAPVNDPFEKANRRGFAIEQTLTGKGVGYLGVIYRALTPGLIGKAIHNILVNLHEPVVFINDLLQLRPARAGATAVRFVANTTVGLGGMIDVTGATGLPHHPSSFGDTLGRYGVHPGPYLFIPLVGPSTVRDLFGNVVDFFLNPLHFVQYTNRQPVSIGLAVVGGVDQLARSEADLRALLSNAADPYATLRSTYLQYREAEVSGQTEIPTVLPSLDDGDPIPAAPPVTSPSGPGGDQASPLQALPDGQDRQTYGQIPGALDQRQGDGHLGTEAEQRPQDRITSLLHANAHGSDDGGAANGRNQGLKADDGLGVNPDPSDAQGQPHAEGAGDPRSQMEKDSQAVAAGPAI